MSEKKQSLDKPIASLVSEISQMIEGRRWRYNELKKDFPYKCWPHTKKAAAKYKKEWRKGIAELNKTINQYKKAIKILKTTPNDK